MKKKLIKTIFENLDEDMRLVDVLKLVNGIEALYKPNTLEELNKIDEDKYPIYTNQVFPSGHWEQDDAGYMIWRGDAEEK